MTVVLLAHAWRATNRKFWSWVWSQNNEHRLPAARLLHLGLLETRRDFRAGMVFDVLLMAGLAAAFVVAAGRIRGRTSVVDAFFPILLLHLGTGKTSCGAGRCSSSS